MGGRREGGKRGREESINRLVVFIGYVLCDSRYRNKETEWVREKMVGGSV